MPINIPHKYAHKDLLDQVKDRFKHILVIDFETVPRGELYHIGAVLDGRVFEKKDIKHLKTAFNWLSEFARDADFILGHNIVNHDLAVARDIHPEAGFLKLPVIDTLFLSPLAFPENPYHKLVKDYKLVKHSKNDPVADARLARAVFDDQLAAFVDLNAREPGLLSVYNFAFELSNITGLSQVFHCLSGPAPDEAAAKFRFREICRGKVCDTGLETVWNACCSHPSKRPMLAYILSWIRVSGGNSIIPPWVKHEFNEIASWVRTLRYACGNDSCAYCLTNHDSEALLKQFFGFEHYRALSDGRVLQKEIIEANLAGKSLLGILPTGGGKSICYQIPALHRYHRLGDLTVVISPLKALMKDQVDNLNSSTGMESSAAINGSLTLPERGAVMDKVRLGDIGLLYISPEQLRNISIAELIKTRDVGCWVFDEAHCLSKWGHDFRPDYLHVTEFISNYVKASKTFPLVGAFTATAKKDVIEEISSHFNEHLGLNLVRFEGGVQRDNLHFQVWPVTKNEKYDVIANCIQEYLTEPASGAIVYCATQKNTEMISEFLNEKGIPSKAFHAGRSEPDKRNIQDDFVAGNIPVICATNAFGMGIDKKDIRLVIHADTPGSLENYLQEAGRAGRDLNPSDCILLYEQEDIENQFSLNAYSRLSFKDIRKILSILKKRGANAPDIVITPGEIMRLIGYKDSSNDDNRARIGVSWLERKGFIERSYNQTLFFKGTPRVRDMAEAEQKIEALNLSKIMKAVYLTVLSTLFNADKDKLLSADDICTALGRIDKLPSDYLDSRYVIRLLSQMAEAGLIREGTVMTAFVKPKGKGSAPSQLDFFSNVEEAMLRIMQDMAPDAWMSPDIPDVINLRLMSQRLKDQGFEQVNVDSVEKIIRAMAQDKGENQGKSLKISGKQGLEQHRVYVKFPWDDIKKRMTLRHNGSRICVEAIIACLPPHLRHGQAQVMTEFFMSDIIKAMQLDLFLSAYTGDTTSLVEQCLLYLHDLKIITLQNGLGVFRQALTLSVLPESQTRQYTKGDYEPLSHHYAQKNVQVHVMEKYAHLGLEKIKSALSFVSDYFTSSYEGFVHHYFQDQKKIIETAMTSDAYKRIIQSLENTIQETIVAAPPEKNILVLAGPGSGKTRTIVHRCAWLIKAKSVDPASILVLCFNHQAMIELRKRIKALVGRSADFVTAMTYHGFAMRITGRSLIEKTGLSEFNFDTVIDEAVDILAGAKEIEGLDAQEARDTLLAQYRYILVDEYQDIDARQYSFISALTGRLEKDRDSRIAIMAVGDDDQSIYGFRHANVAFIKQFQNDYEAESFYLVENYRSSYPIIEAANALIALNKDRMKTDKPGRINRKRKSDQNSKAEPVQIVHVRDVASQAVFVADTIKGILQNNPEACPGDFAVISRQGIAHPYLVALRMALAKEGMEFCYSIKNSVGFPIIKIREIQALIDYLTENKKQSIHPEQLKKDILDRFESKNTWTNQVEQILTAWCKLTPDMEISLSRTKDFVLETLLEDKREHKTGTGVFMGTVHSVKGMEFPYVFILDGGWHHQDMEEERRLFYVGMTRAEKALYLCRLDGRANPHIQALTGHPATHETTAAVSELQGFSEDLTVSILGMEDLYISYAGFYPETHKLHINLAALKTGDKVRLIEQENRIHIVNTLGQSLATLSKKATETWKNKTQAIVNAKVLGMVKRGQNDGHVNESFNLKVESWEIPIVEILHTKTT
ncbi:MAG: RecQ family ATP-dependent DNA helicase [Proteobacteria bacterium]|nr:RecQ family ATP-dependent DNA helicase [Pseudomonadota bacterium]